MLSTPHIWLLLLPAAAVAAGAILSAVYALGRVGQRRHGRPSLSLPVTDGDTALDRAIAPLVARHVGESGLTLLTGSLEALRARRDSAHAAGRSLDLQYYYWKRDLTGRLLLADVIAAARRGVRVRMLLDDINAFGFDASLLALDSHPNIEVRLFNPSRSRADAFRRGLELAATCFTATRRMHNKCWLADGRVMIAGGRNIGDAYFGASREANFQDIDLYAVGACVDEAQAVFDRYWNSGPALPVRALHGMARVRRPRLKKLERRLARHLATPRARALLAHLGAAAPADEAGAPFALHWSHAVEVMADPPEKASGLSRQHWMGERINALIRGARFSLSISSPYFIPGAAGAKTLAALAASGRSVRVLTNSLAATDVIAVHGAYARYRKRLAAAGVSIHELKPEPGRHRASLFGSRTASLHTKALLADGETGVVGSFNLDPRSLSINTEMGIAFRCPDLVRQLDAAFAAQASAEASYEISLTGGRIVWRETRDGWEIRHRHEPEAPLRRRVPAWLVSWLPIESQL